MGGASSTSTVQGFTGMNSGIDYNNRNTQGSANGLVSLGYSKELLQDIGLNLAANVYYVIGNQNAGSGGNGTVFNDGFRDVYEGAYFTAS